MSIVTPTKRDRRRMGRPRNMNRPPTDAALRTTKKTLDELDRLVQYPRMPLGMKLETLIAEIKNHRKNVGGYLSNNQTQLLSVNKVYDVNDNESTGTKETEEEWRETVKQLSAHTLAEKGLKHVD